MIRIEQKITELWQVFRADSAEGLRARRRTAATAAMTIAVLALLVSVGLVALVLVILVMATTAACLLGTALLLRRHRARLRRFGAQLWERGSATTQRAVRAGTDWSTEAGSRLAPVVRRGTRMTASTILSASRGAQAAGRSLRTATAESANDCGRAAVSLSRRAS